VLGLVGFGVWYGLSPPIPEVRLVEGADPALAAEVSRATWAIRRSPWSDKARGRLAMLLHVHTLNPEAAVYYAQAEELNPSEPRWPYLHAFVVADDPPAELELLRRAAQLIAGRAGAPDAPLLKLADTCLEQEVLDEAVQDYRRLLADWPEHPRAHLGLARLAVLRDRSGEALAHLKSCLDAPTTRKAAHTVLAEVDQRQGKKEEAARAGRQAAELPRDAPWPDPWMEEARTLLVGRQGRLYRLAELQEQGRLSEAMALEKKTNFEEYPDIRCVITGRMRLDRGQLAEAEAALREAVGLNPESVPGHFYLGKALFEQKRYGDAAASFRRVTELEPAHGTAYWEWSRCALALGDRPEAVRLLRLAVRYMPQNAEARRTLDELPDR
jgi:tetratricopeptide (TPR) repeat protein